MTEDDGVTVIRPVTPSRRTGSDLGTWFEAPTAFGPLRLAACDAAGPAPHAAAAAIVLHRCEELLGALETWAGQAHAWRWLPSPAGGAVAASQVRLQWRGTFHQLMGSWTWLRSLAPPPDALAGRLVWPALPVVLSIARMRLGADDLLQLEPGGAVVLPQSLQPAWHGLMRGADESTFHGFGVAVALDSPRVPRLVRGAVPAESVATVGDKSGTLCEVRLAVSQEVGTDRLAGWSEAELGDLVSDNLEASLWRCASEHGPARCLARGRLMPWGDGWALGLESLGAPQTEGIPPDWLATKKL